MKASLTSSLLLLLLLGILASSSVVLSEERMAGPTLRCFPGFHEPEDTGRLHKNSSSSSDRNAAKDMIHFILYPFWWRNYRKVLPALFWYCAQEVSIKGNLKTGFKNNNNYILLKFASLSKKQLRFGVHGVFV